MICIGTIGTLEVTSKGEIVTAGGAFKAGTDLHTRARAEYAMFSRAGGAQKHLAQSQERYGLPKLKPIKDSDTRSMGISLMYQRRVMNNFALLELKRSPGKLTSDQNRKLLTNAEVSLMAEIEGVLHLTTPLITFVQIETTVSDSYALFFTAMVTYTLKKTDRNTSRGSIEVMDVHVKPTVTSTAKNFPRRKMKYQDLSFGGKQAWDRCIFAFERWFPEWPRYLLLASFIDPRTRSKLLALVGQVDYEKATDACLEAFRKVARATLAASKKKSMEQGEAESKDEDVSGGIDAERGIDAEILSESDTEMDGFMSLSSIDPCLLPKKQEPLASGDVDDIEDMVRRRAREKMDQFLATPYDVTDAKNRVPGHEKDTLKDMQDLYRCTQVVSWVVSLKEDQTDAFKVCQLHLGGVTASSFLERFFSTCSKVWNKSTSRLSVDKAEKKALLRHNAGLMKEIRDNAMQL